MINSEQRLFQAVVYQAICDAASKSNHDTSATIIDRQRAIQWLSSGGRDFEIVCSLAGLDAEAVRDAWVSGKVDKKLAANRKPASARNAGAARK